MKIIVGPGRSIDDAIQNYSKGSDRRNRRSPKASAWAFQEKHRGTANSSMSHVKPGWSSVYRRGNY